MCEPVGTTQDTPIHFVEPGVHGASPLHGLFSMHGALTFDMGTLACHLHSLPTARVA